MTSYDSYEANQRTFEQFKMEIYSRFDRLETRIDALDAKVEYIGNYLNNRIDDTHTYMGWILGILGIAVVVLAVSKTINEFFRQDSKNNLP